MFGFRSNASELVGREFEETMRDVHGSVTTHETPPPAVISGALLDVARYWLAVGGAQFDVPRCTLDPLVLSPGVLPKLWLADHDAQYGDFRFRLAGEAINEMFGHSVRNHWLSDLFPADKAAAVRQRFERVLRAPCVCYCRGVIHMDQEGHGWSERLKLPLADDSGRLTHILGIVHAVPDDTEPTVGTGHGVEERFFHPDGLRKFCEAAA